jgi:N-acetylmuramoyl-L-alanine amidase
MVDLGLSKTDFKDKIITLLNNSNINDNDEDKGIFNLDSAHDFLFDKSLANVTTDYFSGIPAGVSGEDRYVWYLKQKGIYDNVKYFGVQELKDKKNPSRKFWYLDDDDKLQQFGGTASNISKDTGNFIHNVMFKKNDGDATNKSFLFQTIHDAGKQLITTHMPTVSNHIDSAGTPKRDAKNDRIVPLDYNLLTEGVDGDPPIPDKDYIDSTIMAKDGANEDAHWSNGTGEEHTPSRPWYHTKYSLLIYKYIKTILGKKEDTAPPNLTNPNEINLFVTNFVWQLTMVFCYLSFSIEERRDKGVPWQAIAYLRTIEFTSFEKGRTPKYKIFSVNDNNIYFTFNQWALELGKTDGLSEEFMASKSALWPGVSDPQPWTVTQSICADEILEHIKDPKLFISSRRDEDAKIVDTNILPMFAQAQYLFDEEKDVHKRILQIIKFSGDTSHMVQTILQLEGFKVWERQPTRITVLTTLERILSGRMLNYIKNTEYISTEENVSVLFETGVYLQENDQGRHEQLVKKIKEKQKETQNLISGDAAGVFKGVKIKYFGVYVMENIGKRIESTIISIEQKKASINQNINTSDLNDIWLAQLALIQYPAPGLSNEALVEVNKRLVKNLKDLFEFDDILEQLKNIDVVNIGALVSENLPRQLNVLIKTVLYGFQREAFASKRKRKNVPRHSEFDSKGLQNKLNLDNEITEDHKSGEFSNLTLNIDHTNNDFNKMLSEVVGGADGPVAAVIALQDQLTGVKKLIDSLLDYLNLSNRIVNAGKPAGNPNIQKLLVQLESRKFGTGSTTEQIKARFWESCNGGIGNRDSLNNWYLNSTDNLLILSDQFRQMEFNQPFVLYQNNVKNKVSSMQELSKYINEFNKVTAETEEELAVKKQKLNKMLKGYISFEEFFADFFKYNTINDFSGLIKLISFFVNSGEHASLMSKKDWHKNYERFKDNADEVINILEKLNTLAPAPPPQMNTEAEASQITTNTLAPATQMITEVAQSGNGRKGPLRKPALKKIKKTKKNKKHSKNKSKKNKFLQDGGAGGSDRGATNPVNQSNILIELLKNIKTTVSNTNDEKLKEQFYRTQIVGLLKNYSLTENEDGENEDIKGFIRDIHNLVEKTEPGSREQIDPTTINKFLAELYHIKLSHKDTSSFIEIFSKDNRSDIPQELELEIQRITDDLLYELKTLRGARTTEPEKHLPTQLAKIVKEVTYVASANNYYYYDWVSSWVKKENESRPTLFNEDKWTKSRLSFIKLIQYQVETYLYYLKVNNGEIEEYDFKTQSELKNKGVKIYTDRYSGIITRSKQKYLDSEHFYDESIYKILFLDDKIAEDLAVLAVDTDLDFIFEPFLWSNLDYIYGVYLFDIIESWLLLKKTAPVIADEIAIIKELRARVKEPNSEMKTNNNNGQATAPVTGPFLATAPGPFLATAPGPFLATAPGPFLATAPGTGERPRMRTRSASAAVTRSRSTPY